MQATQSQRFSRSKPRSRRKPDERVVIEVDDRDPTDWGFVPANKLILTRERGNNVEICQFRQGKWQSLEPERNLPQAQYGAIPVDSRLDLPISYRLCRRSLIRWDNVLHWFFNHRLAAGSLLEKRIYKDIVGGRIRSPVAGWTQGKVSLSPRQLDVINVRTECGAIWAIPIGPKDWRGSLKPYVEKGEDLVPWLETDDEDPRYVPENLEEIAKRYDDGIKVIAAAAFRQLLPHPESEYRMVWIPEELVPANAYHPEQEVGFRWPESAPSRLAQVPPTLYYRYST